MLMGIWVSDNADLVVQGDIIVNALSLFEPSNIGKEITVVISLGNFLFPDTLSGFNRFDKAYWTIKLCHFDRLPH